MSFYDNFDAKTGSIASEICYMLQTPSDLGKLVINV